MSDLFDAIGRLLLELSTEGAVQPQPSRGRELLEQRLADERVGEAVPAESVVVLGDQHAAGSLVEQVDHPALRKLGDRTDDRRVELGAGHRRDGEHRLYVIVERRQAPPHHLAHPLGHADIARVERAAHPAAVVLHDRP